MQINVAYLHNKIADIFDESAPLIVHSCGVYRFKDGPIFKTNRPKGRQDYQLLYIVAGKGYFSINGKERALSQGSLILFRPNQPQVYYYRQEEKAEVYWAHFTGSDVAQILSRYGFDEKESAFQIGVSNSLQRLFNLLIQELQLCRACYEEMISALFRQTLLLAQRKIQENASNNELLQSLNDIEQATRYFTENYNKELNVDEYAASINMSTCWFIRRFKQVTGVTPLQYIITLRMTNAKVLLEAHNYNVAQTAHTVGYDNPLYFSRLFTKFVGLSPSEYKRLQNK